MKPSKCIASMQNQRCVPPVACRGMASLGLPHTPPPLLVIYGKIQKKVGIDRCSLFPGSTTSTTCQKIS